MCNSVHRCVCVHVCICLRCVCAVRVGVCVRERDGGGDKERVYDQSSIIGTVKYEINYRYGALVEPFQC